MRSPPNSYLVRFIWFFREGREIDLFRRQREGRSGREISRHSTAGSDATPDKQDSHNLRLRSNRAEGKGHVSPLLENSALFDCWVNASDGWIKATRIRGRTRWSRRGNHCFAHHSCRHPHSGESQFRQCPRPALPSTDAL